MNADHDELLARLDTAGQKWALQYYWNDINDAAAAIRSLQAQLETERKTREEAERNLGQQQFLTAFNKGEAEKQYERAIAAESRLAKVFDETREKMREQLCETCRQKF